MIEAIVDHLIKNRDMIEIIFWWVYVDKIKTAYQVGAYHSKVNYYIHKMTYIIDPHDYLLLEEKEK